MHSTLTSIRDSFTLRRLSKAKSRPPSQLRIKLPPTPSIPFPGLIPITSFLASSPHSNRNPLSCTGPEGVNDLNRSQSRDGHPKHKIGRGIKAHVYPRNETPYSMLYDTVTPELELSAYELMKRLMEDDFPSVHTSSPVRSALDLGCGDGHWVSHAAQAWASQETKITGIYLPLSTDEEQTIVPLQDTDNVKLMCHCFITDRLPFPDNSFDYIHLNNTMVAIPGERWDFVLSEVHRVLSPKGHFKLVHDQLCFPSVGPETPVSCTFAPSRSRHNSRPNAPSAALNKLTSPSPKKSPYEDWEAGMLNCGDIERLYLDMLARRYGVHPQPGTIIADAIQRRFGNESLAEVSSAYVCLPSQEFMTRTRSESPQVAAAAAATTRRRRRPKKREFGIGVSVDWGQDRTGKMMWKVPPSPPTPPTPPEPLSLTSLPPLLSKKAARLMGVGQLSPAGAPYQPPGVVVVHASSSSEGAQRPMTFLSMSPAELDVHANKHVHSVLSAKLALEAHIDELREQGMPAMSHEALDDALWRYAMFRRKRFNWPEVDAFEWESEATDCDGEFDEQTRRFALPDTQTTDGLMPIRLFQTFEVTKVDEKPPW
ncbi:hypothetical protein F5148DRAFT_413855 [Russula earlei]|uniref:Uncharacterized protein n=1 Tax=Russula earlei TaxID=71964 RepID=A0ACC0U0M9_9AGAM|nr:hypothetical protein F5148DRAFT_413855 [Russula earlei]